MPPATYVESSGVRAAVAGWLGFGPAQTDPMWQVPCWHSLDPSAIDSATGCSYTALAFWHLPL